MEREEGEERGGASGGGNGGAQACEGSGPAARSRERPSAHGEPIGRVGSCGLSGRRTNAAAVAEWRALPRSSEICSARLSPTAEPSANESGGTASSEVRRHRGSAVKQRARVARAFTFHAHPPARMGVARCGCEVCSDRADRGALQGTLGRSFVIWGTPGYSWVLQGTPGYSRVLQGAPGCSRVLQGTPGYSRVLQGTPGCSRVLQGTPGYSRVLQGTPGCSRVLQGTFGAVGVVHELHDSVHLPGRPNRPSQSHEISSALRRWPSAGACTRLERARGLSVHAA